MNKNEISKRHASASPRKRASPQSKAESNGFLSLLIASLFGVGIGYVTLLISLVVLSVICLFLKNPHPFLLPLCLFALLVSFVSAGFGAVIKADKHSPYLTAICTGLLFMLTLKAASLMLSMIMQADTAVFYKIFGYITPIFCLPAALWASKPKKIKHRKHR